MAFVENAEAIARTSRIAGRPPCTRVPGTAGLSFVDPPFVLPHPAPAARAGTPCLRGNARPQSSAMTPAQAVCTTYQGAPVVNRPLGAALPRRVRYTSRTRLCRRGFVGPLPQHPKMKRKNARRDSMRLVERGTAFSLARPAVALADTSFPNRSTACRGFSCDCNRHGRGGCWSGLATSALRWERCQ